MTIEEIQKLSELTNEAVEQNDLVAINKIWEIIKQSDETSEFLDFEGNEWFFSSLTAIQMNSLNV